ncbi:MAG: NAD(+) synthase [Bacteroidaceae bacterium]|nr:NAD(+) synthase [Bacteroidaceae bacterium]
MEYGFVRVASAIPAVKVADCKYNVENMLPIIAEAARNNVEILTFPELGITSYSCADLFQQQLILQEAEIGLKVLLEAIKEIETIVIVGMPVPYSGSLLNCAIVLYRGKIQGIVPKSYLPGYSEFNEERWFTSGKEIPEGARVTLCGQEIEIRRMQLFRTASCTFGIEICEDIWGPNPPSIQLALQGAEILFNLSASNELSGKHESLVQMCCQHSRRCLSGYVYSSCGFGESSSDLVFAGNAIIIENGQILKKSKRFCLESQLAISEIDVEHLRHQRMMNTTFSASRNEFLTKQLTITNIPQKASNNTQITRKFTPHPFMPTLIDSRCEEIFSIQAAGLAKRLLHTGAKTCVLGVSGGLDSTLALLVAIHSFDLLKKEHSEIIGVTMPGFGTTGRTHKNALTLMQSLGITQREVSIKDACIQHFKDINHDINVHDVTYENAQARERTQILMDISNQTNGFVLGTGDLSELALGWATYNGDHMSMYAVNASVPKTLVQHLVRWYANNLANEETRSTLLDILDTPISPELIPAHDNGEIKQITEDLVGPYELHDFFLYHFMNNGYAPQKLYFIARNAFNGIYDDETIKKWLKTFIRRFFTQQFKRSCMPDGPKVCSCSLSPRGDWRMPSDASYNLWLAECEKL